MDKHAVLDALKELAAAGAVTEAEVVAAWREAAGHTTSETAHRQSRFSQVLSFIGGGVILLGIVAFIAQIWHDLGAGLRILLTLGSGLVAYASGALLSWSGRVGAAGMGVFLIAALVLPLGMVVTLDEAGMDPESLGLQSLVALALTGAFLVAHLLFKGNSLLVYTIVYAAWACFAISDFLVGADPRFADAEFVAYRVLALGLAGMLLGYAFTGTSRQGLAGALYGFGCLGFLGAALGLGGWHPSNNAFWELVFPGLAFAVVYASIHLKSKVLLTFGSLFLGAYLAKLTGEYFADSLGWPIALMMVGVMLMVLGYVTLRLKRIYLSEETLGSQSTTPE